MASTTFSGVQDSLGARARRGPVTGGAIAVESFGLGRTALTAGSRPAASKVADQLPKSLRPASTIDRGSIDRAVTG